MSYVFGIDLGTTYSCIAYLDQYNKPVVIPNADGEDTTPSVVLFDSASNVVVGAEAKRSAKVEPDKVVQFIKRKMGKQEDKVTINGTKYSAPEVSAYILKKLVSDANDQLIQEGVLSEGEQIHDVVITCPAYFGMNEKQATKTAGELAGLHVLNIINEPTAAAISYGVSGQKKDETVLVFDLGGGTFDITVMNITGNQITVVCTGGDDQLGGKDWDEKLMDYVVARYEEEYGENLYEDPDAIAELYLDVETWKKTLTTREKVNISINGPAGRLREELTRAKYDELTYELLNRTRNLLDDVLKTAAQRGYPLENIHKILLVGGSSKMPQVAAMLEKVYGKKPVLQDPNLAVAKGAAIYAGNQKAYNEFVANKAAETGRTVDELEAENLTSHELDRQYAALGRASGDAHISITNVLSRTYGIAAYDNDDVIRIFNMLKINDALPTSTEDTFCTRSRNQQEIDIDLYESRSTEAVIAMEDRKPITTFHMRFTQMVPKGTAVRIRMALDTAGMLHVIAEEQLYGSKLDTTFRLSNQLEGEELRAAISRTSSTTVE